MNRLTNSSLPLALAAIAGRGKLTVIVGDVHGGPPILQSHDNGSLKCNVSKTPVVLDLDQRTSITLGSRFIHDFTDTGVRSALWRTMLSRPMKSYLVKWACFTSQFHLSRTIP